MLAVIPAAGVGTRLRPHTLNRPKAMLPVAGKPILAHIVDDLTAVGIDRFVLIVGYHGQAVRDWFAAERPGLAITFVEQRERLGLGHAIWTARAAVGEQPFFCVLGDTILKADYEALIGADTSTIGVREVADPRRFGVVEIAGDRVVRCVEKPDQPPSNLAIVGAYSFRDAAALWRALSRIVGDDIRTKNEFQLTDALQLMLEAGETFKVVKVSDWHDCGKRETWLATNRVLLDRSGGDGGGEGIVPPCFIAPDAVLAGARVGPHVTIGSGSRVENCELTDCVIGASTVLSSCRLSGSLVGDHCRITAARGSINIGDYGEFTGHDDRDR
jgi:glucose-1-phosphate thymidylyltransferase